MAVPAGAGGRSALVVRLDRGHFLVTVRVVHAFACMTEGEGNMRKPVDAFAAVSADGSGDDPTLARACRRVIWHGLQSHRYASALAGAEGRKAR